MQYFKHVKPVALVAFLVIITAALTFLGVRYNDFQHYKLEVDREISSLIEDHEREIEELTVKVERYRSTSEQLYSAIKQPVLYEAGAPKGDIPEVEDE